MELEQIGDLVRDAETRVLLLVIDGLGGLPGEAGGRTELETAETANLDELARAGGTGLHDPVAPGITPGSGPGHLALFGYDPLRYHVGRGVLEALGIGFDLRPGDVAARGNFCTVDADGRVADRRAGRISTAEAEEVADRLRGVEVAGAEAIVRQVREHRFLLVLRPEGELSPEVVDTDPGRPGVPPREARASAPRGREAARVVREWVEGARERLRGEERANMVLLRGFSSPPDWPRFPEVWGMDAMAVAAYPMYRGAARLVGMAATEVEDGVEALVREARRRGGEHDFLFLHFKGTDRAGEDGDFDRKVSLIEEVDRRLPEILAYGPDVVLVTGDHSTPAVMRSHSWHPVPFLISGGAGHRTGGTVEFGERGCAAGALGRRRGRDLMRLAAAQAGRLSKYGA